VSFTKASQSVISATIVGTYLTADKKAKVKIFLAKNGKYSGKTIWLKEPNNSDGSPKTDINNPNEVLQKRERLGLVALKHFVFDIEDQRWENGTVYDPRNGKTYDGYMKFEEGNTDKLLLRGYISGMTWLGKTSEWTRVKN
jgi:uncharacterized protein (DUF2147 family)